MFKWYNNRRIGNILLIKLIASIVISTTLITTPIPLGEFKITHYCNCPECCGKWAGGNTASGTKPTPNRTIAVDTNVIPFNTKVIIDGQVYIAEDTGNYIKGNRIDIYTNNHQQALQLGVIYRKVYLKQ